MLNFLLLFLLAFLLFPICSFIFVFFSTIFSTKSTLKILDEKVQILGYDYKVFVLRKEYAEEHAIDYTTPFAFNYSTDRIRIETEAMSQVEFLGKLTTLETEIEEIMAPLNDKLKASDIMLDINTRFNYLKRAIREANPYVY